MSNEYKVAICCTERQYYDIQNLARSAELSISGAVRLFLENWRQEQEIVKKNLCHVLPNLASSKVQTWCDTDTYNHYLDLKYSSEFQHNVSGVAIAKMLIDYLKKYKEGQDDTWNVGIEEGSEVSTSEQYMIHSAEYARVIAANARADLSQSLEALDKAITFAAERGRYEASVRIKNYHVDAIVNILKKEGYSSIIIVQMQEEHSVIEFDWE